MYATNTFYFSSIKDHVLTIWVIQWRHLVIWSQDGHLILSYFKISPLGQLLVKKYDNFYGFEKL